MTEKTQALYEKKEELWGTTDGLVVCMEECAELAQAISKVIRYGFDDPKLIDHLYEEMNDVKMSLDALKYLIHSNTGTSYENIQLNLKTWEESKTDRLHKRLTVEELRRNTCSQE